MLAKEGVVEQGTQCLSLASTWVLLLRTFTAINPAVRKLRQENCKKATGEMVNNNVGDTPIYSLTMVAVSLTHPPPHSILPSSRAFTEQFPYGKFSYSRSP